MFLILTHKVVETDFPAVVYFFLYPRRREEGILQSLSREKTTQDQEYGRIYMEMKLKQTALSAFSGEMHGSRNHYGQKNCLMQQEHVHHNRSLSSSVPSVGNVARGGQ